MTSISDISDITDEQIIETLTALYTNKAKGYTGHLCIEYNRPNNTLDICQYPSGNSWTRVEKDGTVWDCPHVHCIDDYESARDILIHGWDYIGDELPETPDGYADPDKCDEELLRAINEIGPTEGMIERTREKIEASLSASWRLTDA